MKSSNGKRVTAVHSGAHASAPGGAHSYVYGQEASERGAAMEVRFPDFRPVGNKCDNKKHEVTEAEARPLPVLACERT